MKKLPEKKNNEEQRIAYRKKIWVVANHENMTEKEDRKKPLEKRKT